MKTYHANVKRDGKFWFIHVAEVHRATQARDLREADEMARDLISLMDGVAHDSFDVQLNIELPATVRAHLKRSEELRERAAAAQTEAAEESSLAARELVSTGMSLREVGIALGMSYQRAHQLVKRQHHPLTR